MPDTIEQELEAAGFGHRRTPSSANTGEHEIYRLDTGERVGRMTAHEAAEFAKTGKAPVPATLPGLETTPEAMAESVMVLIRDTDDKLKAARKMKDYRVVGILEAERDRLIRSYRAVRAKAQGNLF